MNSGKKLLIIIGLIAVDILFLGYFNTLVWPYLWPRLHCML